MAGLFLLKAYPALKPYFLITFVIILSCKTPDSKLPPPKAVVTNPLPKKNTILLQPLNDISDGSILFLKNRIAAIYNAEVTVLQPRLLPANAHYALGKRYTADTLLVFLKSLLPNRTYYVLGVTGKDIATKKGNNLHWGIMGLGYQPGNACVISDYRLSKYPQTQMQLNEKLLKVALHELGHNFGLPHCPDEHCIMTDAKGKDKLNNEKGFCSKCNTYLRSNGFMR